MRIMNYVKTLFIFWFFFSPMPAFAGSVQLPQTGQTACYNSGGTPIECVGTGQDGDLRAGVAWPEPRFTDNGDQTMTDNLTGLIWAKDGNVMHSRNPELDTDGAAGDGMVTWQHALDYIKTLNAANYMGHNDWRLPNVIELESLVNANGQSQSILLNSQGFLNVQGSRYWSSSTSAGNIKKAFIIGMSDGSVEDVIKVYNPAPYYYIWPVRAGESGSSGFVTLPKTGQITCYDASGASIDCAGTGQDGQNQILTGTAWPGTRFIDNGDQTVLDNLTGLIWAQDGNAPGPSICGTGIAKTWQGALDHVQCLNTNNYLGRSNWRLPNRKELRSLVHAGQSNSADWLNSTGIISNVQAGYYWSSSTYAEIPVGAWVVDLEYGYANGDMKSADHYIWPVSASQTITVTTAAPAAAAYGSEFTVAATASSGLPVSFTSGSSTVCTANGATFTMTATSGTCIVQYDQAGNGSYTAAQQVINSTTAAKANQTIGAISFTPATLADGGATTASATATSGLGVTFTSTTTDVCTVSGTTVTGLAAGTCIIAANQAGDANYSAADEVTQAITVGPGSQAITVTTAAPPTAAYNSQFTVAATAYSGLPVSYSSGSPSVCTANGATFTMIASSGTCIVQYDQAGNVSYTPAQRVTNSTTAAKANQTIGAISFTPATLAVGGATAASASATSGLGVTFTSTTPGVCTVSGTMVTGLTAGTCTIAANQAGDANYNAAGQVTQAITVGPGSQAITVTTAAPDTAAYNSQFTVAATASSGLSVRYSSGSPTVCTPNGATFIMTAPSGICIVQYDQAGNDNYTAATRVTNSTAAAKANQTIGAVSFTPATLAVGGVTTASATATSGLGVTFTSTTTDVCTVSGTTVTGLIAGTCMIAANQAGNTKYNAADEVIQAITVGSGGQSIAVMTAAPATAAYGSEFTVAATATSGLPVSFTSGSPTVCTANGATFTMIAPSGTCIVQYDQAGDDNYTAAQQVINSTAAVKANQTIGAVSFTPATLAVGGSTAASASSTSGLGVTFTSTTTGVCTISGTTVTGLTAGTCIIAANQAGDANYNPAGQVTQAITVGPGSQTIAVTTAAPATAAYGSEFTVAATATSGLPVSFTSGSPTVCTASGATFTMIAPSGTCIVQYDQAGNTNYTAATRLTNNVTAGRANQTIGAVSFNPATLAVGGSTTASATATSGLGVTFTSTTTGVCTVSGTTVTGLTAGTCTIAANQAGDANYTAAGQVTQAITVDKGSQSIAVTTAAPATAAYNSQFTVAATASSGLPVSFTSGSPTVCTANGGTFTMIAPSGTCIAQYDQAGNDNYTAATRLTNNVTAGKANQTIGAVNFTPATLAVGGSTTASASATSGLGVTFTSTTAGVCTVSGTTVTGLTAGTCMIAANQAGDANYNPADEVTQAITVGPGSQSITVTTAAPATAAYKSEFTVAATAGSGLPVSYSSGSPTVCTAKEEATFTMIAPSGTCIVQYDQAGDGSYTAAQRVTNSTTAAKANQTIGAVSFTPATLAVGGATTASASATSGLGVTFTSTTTGVCTVSGTTVTGLTAGTCTIAASQPGDANYNAAGQVTQAITVEKGSQAITVTTAAPATAAYNSQFTVAATASSGLPVSFTSGSPTVCTANGGTFTMIAPSGTCIVQYDQAGNTNYMAATRITSSTTAAKANQTIDAVSFTPATLAVGGSTTASASSTSGLGVTFTSTTTGICTVSGTTVIGLTAGTCTIAANQAGDANYNPAGQVTQAITVDKGSQTITVTTAAPSTAAYNSQFTVAATASSGLTVSYSSGSPAVCTASGATFTMIAPSGTCIVQYDQAGNDNYTAATRLTNNVTAAKANQTIGAVSFTPATLAVGGNATASAIATSGLGVTFTSTTTGICTVSGTTVTGLTAGICIIAANQAGDANYNAADEVTQAITVDKGSQTITVTTAAPSTAAYNSQFTVAATATSGLPVSFTSGSPAVCTGNGATFTMIASSGTCIVQYDQAGNTNYMAATRLTNNVTAAKANQTIGAVSFTPATLAAGGSTTASASSTSGLGVTFTSTTTGVCTVSGTTVTGLTAGTCTIAANQAGDANYTAAGQVTQSITVDKGSQAITVTTAAPATAAYGSEFTVAATASSGLPVSFTNGSPTVCTANGATFTMIAPSGTCIVQYDQAGNTNYTAAQQVTNSTTAAKANQTIGAISFTPATLAVGGNTTVSASATSGLGVTFTSTTTSVCTVSGTTVTGLTAGTCTIAANQAGDANYNAADEVTQAITVGPGSQAITVTTAAPATAAYGSQFTVAATAFSGLPVSYSSGSHTVCTANGGTFTMIAPSGTCIVQYDQAGNGSYTAAQQVTNSTAAAKANQTIGAISFTPATLAVGGSAAASASSSSGLGVTFTSTTTGVCTVSGTTVTGLTAGTCTIAANQAGDANYTAAGQVTQAITVGPGSQAITVTTAAPATAAYNSQFTVAATASSGLSVSFTSGSPTVCTANGATFTMIAPSGTCIVQYDQAGNDSYTAAQRVTNSTTAAKANQTIGAVSFTPATLAVGGSTTASASATSGQGVTFTSITTGICTVSGTTVTGLTAGICTIAANQAGDANYNAAGQVNQSITVGPGSQTIAVTTTAPATAAYNSQFTVAATASSGLPVSFTSGSPAVCTASGATFTMIAPSGTCIVQYDQAGNTNYTAATRLTNNVTAAKANQTIGAISFTPAMLAVGGNTTASASATSGLGVTFTSTTTGVCTVSGTTVTGLTAGTCIIAANQAGDANYTAAGQVTQSITVDKGSQAITVTTAAPATAAYNSQFTVAATASSGLSVSFTSGSPTVCTANGATFTMIAPSGTCIVQYDQAGNTSYMAATRLTNNVTAAKASQTIGAISFTPATLAVGGNTTASASATSGLGVTFTSTTTGVCTVSGTTVTGLTAGTCTIAANQTGDANYNPANEVTQAITVGPGSQAITVTTAAPATASYGSQFTVAATAFSGLPVSYSSGSPSVCTANGAIFTMIAPSGICIVQYDQAGNGSYTAAQRVTNSTAAVRANQTIGTFSFTPATLAVGGSSSASATASSGLDVTLTSTTTGVCTVSGATVTGLTAGTCTIAANQAGDANYNPAGQVTQAITVDKGSQAITVTIAAPATAVYNSQFTVAATATSGLPVSFTSGSPTVCRANGATFTMIAPSGTCIAQYDQAGNDNYTAATRLTSSTTAGKANQAIDAISFNPATLAVGGATTASATATSGLGVTFTSTTTGVCTVSGTTVTGLTTGTCMIAANQAGDANYNAAGQVNQNIPVGKGAAIVTLGSLNQLYDGTQKMATATTSPSGLTVTFTYDGDTTAPIDAGIYAVVGTVSDANYQGSASGVLTIAGIPGDLDGSRQVDLIDAVLAFQVSVRMHPAPPLYPLNEVGGNHKIGMDDAIYILQKIAGLRP